MRKIYPFKRLLFLPAMLAVFCLSGCVPVPKPLQKWIKPASSPEHVESPALEATETEVVLEEVEPKEKIPGDLVHEVQWKGESLSLIAKWYTGDAGNWKNLSDLNRLSDPHRIHIGCTISIPASLLITREPLPRACVTDSLKTSEEAEPAGDDEKKPALFGPRDLPEPE